jgi:hypothetical protein
MHASADFTCVTCRLKSAGQLQQVPPSTRSKKLPAGQPDGFLPANRAGLTEHAGCPSAPQFGAFATDAGGALLG